MPRILIYHGWNENAIMAGDEDCLIRLVLGCFRAFKIKVVQMGALGKKNDEVACAFNGRTPCMDDEARETAKKISHELCF